MGHGRGAGRPGSGHLTVSASPPADVTITSSACDPHPGDHRPRPLLLACRNTAAAVAAAAALTRPGAGVAALVAVSDGWPPAAGCDGPVPGPVPQVDAVIQIPFIPALRMSGRLLGARPRRQESRSSRLSHDLAVLSTSRGAGWPRQRR